MIPHYLDPRFTSSSLVHKDANHKTKPAKFRLLSLVPLVLLSLRLMAFDSQATETNNEPGLISILRSSASFVEKNAACAQLKRVGTSQSVPALAALLTDDQLSHAARYALESLPGPEAETALIQALDQAAGLNRLGIIQSLGARGEPRAIPALSKTLNHADPGVRAASATALGQIGGLQAVAALEAAKLNLAPDAPAPVRDALTGGLLRCAQRLLQDGNLEQALKVFESIHRDQPSDGVRLAAYRGMILASSKSEGLKRMVDAITGTNGPDQSAALGLVRSFEGEGATAALADLLSRVAPPVEVALIESLAQRGDPAAAPAMVQATKSPDTLTRTAALAGLGALDDTSSILRLAEAAASATGPEQAAARQSLTVLKRYHPALAMLTALPIAPLPVQAELARALGERSETTAAPRLIELARQGPDSVRAAALQALARLADQAQIPTLISLILEARTDSARAPAVEALNRTFQRLQAKQGHVDPSPLVQALATNSAEGRIALLPVCSGLADPQVRAALRTALGDTDAPTRQAAVRALADSNDPELLPELLEAARATAEENLRTLAIGGWVRLAIREPIAKVPPSRQIEGLAALLATPLTIEQKRLLLSGMAEVPATEILALAEPFLTQEPVRVEASRALISIAAALPEPALAAATLKGVLASAQEADVRQAADAALKAIEARAGYLTSWKVAGPFRQAGKDYAALFDIVFPPETDGAAEWRPLPPGSDPSRPWLMDLLKPLGGEQCVAYARTWVFSERATQARLEMGSDDGVKAWINHELALANNVARPLTPASDKAAVNLKAGWNLCLLKITQNNLGWEFCARLTAPDGGLIEGLKSDANR